MSEADAATAAQEQDRQAEAPDDEPVVDAEVVVDDPADDEPGRELALTSAGGGAIIAAEKPAEVLAKATEIADVLKDMIERQGLAVNVGGKRKHVEVGGWQALGAMLGALGGQALHAETVWTRKIGEPVEYHVTEPWKKWGKVDGKRAVIEEGTREYDVEGHDWEARVEVRTPDGRVVGSAEAMCSRAESSWARRPDPAVRAMAETRAESRAYRRAVGWIVNIAGYSATPADEMGAAAEAASEAPPLPWWAAPAPDETLEKCRKAITYLMVEQGPESPQKRGALVSKVLKSIEELPAGPEEDAGKLGNVPLAFSLGVQHAARELAHHKKAEADAADAKRSDDAAAADAAQAQEGGEHNVAAD